MFVQATISCECCGIFDTEFQKSSVENPPVCPQCKKKMDKQSWESLRDIMSRTSDFNQHIIKWNLERGEPRMLVPTITARTL